MLRCPVCKKSLFFKDKGYCCDNKHRFDMAKQGYTNLYLKSSKHSGDNKEMVEARTSFLKQDYYQPLANALIDVLNTLPHEVIIDAGCGEGYYTNYMKKRLISNIYAFDLSKEALKYASRNNENVNYFISSVFDLPMEDGCADMVLNIFAPLAQEEYSRVLKQGGYFIKVDPNRDHLKEMKLILYDTVYENEILDLKVEGFVLEDYKELEFKMELDNNAIKSLFKMTPYYYKTSKESSEKLLFLSKLDCTASFIIYIYKKIKDK